MKITTSKFKTMVHFWKKVGKRGKTLPLVEEFMYLGIFFMSE